MDLKKIAVIGLGGVGLPFAVATANRGFNVQGIDIDRKKVKKINRAIPPFHEPFLKERLQRAIKDGRLTCSTDYQDVVNSDIIFVTVPSPLKNGTLDLTAVENVAQNIAKNLGGAEYQVVAFRSTLPPNTTLRVLKPLMEKESSREYGPDFSLCYDPEFLARGLAFKGIEEPDFVIIGEADRKSGELLEEFYSKLTVNSPKIIRTTPLVAEVTKLLSNAFLAMKISFANTVYEISEELGISSDEVTKILGYDKRINPYFLKGGLSYGGGCFHKDIRALITFAKALGCSTNLYEVTEVINQKHISYMVSSLEGKLGGLEGRKIVVLGLTYKPNTDDITNSPAIEIVRLLTRRGAHVSVYCPGGMKNARRILGNSVDYLRSPTETRPDCYFIAVPWDEFKELPSSISLETVVVDPWRILPFSILKNR